MPSPEEELGHAAEGEWVLWPRADPARPSPSVKGHSGDPSGGTKSLATSGSSLLHQGRSLALIPEAPDHRG